MDWKANPLNFPSDFHISNEGKLKSRALYLQMQDPANLYKFHDTLSLEDNYLSKVILFLILAY